MKKIDWKINWRKLKYIPKSTGLRILILATGLAEVLFLVLLLVLGVLPATYVAVIILVLLLIDAIILQLMNGVKFRRTKSLIAMVIAMLLINVLLIGDVYVYSTYDTLKKISAWHDTWEYYKVVALKDGSYQKIGDVKGKTVYTVDMESKQLTEASERLITKEEVNFETVSGLLNLGQMLVDDGSDVSEKDVSELASATEEEIAQAADKLAEEEAKAKDEESSADGDEETAAAAGSDQDAANVELNDNVILVSNSGYKLIKSNIKGFKKNTEVIYKIKVKKRADDTSKAVDVTKDSFNVLISGLDSWGTIDEGGLSDVNMVMTVNPQTRQVLLTSIPRDSYIPLPVRLTDKPFLMPIEDIFSITGRGTVVTGRIEAGTIHVNDPVELVGFGEKPTATVVTGVEMFRKLLDQGEAGDNVGLLLRGIDKKAVKRGEVLAKPGSITPHVDFKAQIYVLKKEEGGRHTPFHNHYRPQFFIRTLDVTGEIMLPEGVEMVMPGDNVEITVKLITPVAMNEGLQFAIREGGRTVGAGQVIAIVD